MNAVPWSHFASPALFCKDPAFRHGLISSTFPQPSGFFAGELPSAQILPTVLSSGREGNNMRNDPSQATPQEGEFWPNLKDPPSRTIKTVLLAEDSEDDIFMMKMACERSGVPHRLQIVTDGQMAMDYISGRGVYDARHVYPMPDIIFLDLKMPKVDGFEVLKLIRAKPGLKGLPVVVLSTSTLMQDIDRAYQLGATSYLVKMPSQKEFDQAIKVTLQCWLQLNLSAR